jgi:signal transduction histidine kinase
VAQTVSGDRTLETLENLLEVDARDIDQALDSAATVIANVLGAEKVDAFLRDEGRPILRARGTSETQLGRKQQRLGLDVLPIANRGRSVWVFETGNDYLHGHVDDDPEELEGVKRLGVRSSIATPLLVAGEARGVLQACSTAYDSFGEADLRFLRGVAHWVGTLAHRAELREQATRAALDEGRRLAAEELVTVLAHDLGNYLTPLRGRLELSLREARRHGRQTDIERLEGAIANVDGITSLTGDLLDVSRIEEGILRLEPTSFEIRPIAESVARALATDRVRVRVEMPAELCVRADAQRLRQVLVNLIGNAVHHSPKGGTVSVSARDDERAVEIRVVDEGPGVPSEVIPRLFARFARGPRSTGLGLGLYLAERIAVAHGGTLAVDSSPSGATFILRLPK